HSRNAGYHVPVRVGPLPILNLPPAVETGQVRRMGRAQRNPSPSQATQLIDIAALYPSYELASALLSGFIVGNQSFKQFALFRNLFSRIVQHVAGEIILGFVFDLASLHDLCIAFRISSPQFGECDNAAASKLGV